MRQVLSLTPFHRLGSQGSERLRVLPTVTQLISREAGRDQIKSVFMFLTPLSFSLPLDWPGGQGCILVTSLEGKGETDAVSPVLCDYNKGLDL